MNDPWKVLGVPQGASQEEIKTAYRKLVKQYHPDRYTDNPLKELAQEKLKSINEAYDTLTRSNGTYTGAGSTASRDSAQPHTGSSYAGQGSRSGASGDFLRIRQLIDGGNIAMAESMLDAMAQQPAEWYFLKGICLLRRGMYIQARQHMETAVQMDPGNPEYLRALGSMQGGGWPYRRQTYRAGGAESDLCQACQCLICSDCCCECMGGDLVPCC